ncbi:acyl transferase/acyl hydrolase/lysophospholipase [Staphylotrichum tortipilum]|uniref:Patatin-like phospholipase domain-containing protein n=1 Tax=Staphylotrichum tortipilum TaxID=2831512 RepID=A0AAN6MPH1_9PEZI|nr:acyl transferase/acyl hydrolase/lysophospholipase [Staphylotrichum longicolle]
MHDLLVHGPRTLHINPSDPGSQAPSTPSPLKSRRKKKCPDNGLSQVTRLVQGASNLVLSLRDGLSESEREQKRRTAERRDILVDRMNNALTLKDWEAAATELDLVEGHHEWKRDDADGPDEYRPDLIRAELDALDKARSEGDVGSMMYRIRTAFSRELGGMGHMDLYRRSYIGTKELVERYVSSAIETVSAVVDKAAVSPDADPRELLEGMVYARQSFGRSALLLSGGATFGMAHIGVLKTLFEQRLLPRIISGASAGSIVCSVLCTRKDDEVPSLIQAFPFGDLSVFQAEHEGVSDHIRHLLTKGSWADISNLTRVMRSWLGDITFLEAYNRTRRICNICVSSASVYDVPRLLNYITAPNVLIWSAVAASCSVPLIFQSQPLLMKHPKTGRHEHWIPTPQQFIDGSVDNDLPMTRLAEMFNVNHFIVSQVNPHVVPFLDASEQPLPGELRDGSVAASQPRRADWLDTVSTLAKEEVLHRMMFVAELGIFPNALTKLLAVISQKYSGDINILPQFRFADLPLMLQNPTPFFMLRNCLVGERATWPKLSRIRDRLAIELALDQAVHALRARVVFSKSQVDLRRSLGGGGSAAVAGGGSGNGGGGERSMGRRRGSGASIQLVVARHKKSFFQPDEEEEEDDDEDGERLELAVRSSRGSTRGSLRGGGGGASPSPAIVKPRLRRNAKSQGHMRGGRPVAAEVAQQHPSAHFPRLSASEFFWHFEMSGADPGEGVVAAMTADPSVEAVAGVGGGGGVGGGIEVGGEGSGLSAEGWVDAASPQTSDGGLYQSDADPYAGPQGRLRGREGGSKLRYSESESS